MKNQRTSLRERVTGFERKYFGDFLATEVNAKDLAGITCAGVFLGSTLFGCASYGNLKSSKEVTENFKNYEVKQDHNYFRAGARKDSPDVILGLDGQYTLDNTKFWHPVNPNMLEKLVRKMQDTASESNNIPYGANVIGPDGNDLADWYSTANTTTVKKDGKKVTIYTPSPGGSSGGGGGESSSGDGGGGGGSGGSGQ